MRADARSVVVVVPRVAPRHAWPDPTIPSCELFLPLDPARRGFIVVWDGAHNEAAMGYLNACRPPATDAERQAADRLIARYRAFVRRTPDPCPVEVRHRMPENWTRVAWAHS